MRAYFSSGKGEAFVSFSDGGKVLHVERGDLRGDLLRLFDAGLGRIGMKPSDVSEIAVDRGPGGFSAVRRRVSVATALAEGLGSPLAATGPMAPEEAASLKTSAFKKGTRVAPLYDGEPNITAPKRKTRI